MFILGLSFLSTAYAINCYQCMESYDHDGNPAGPYNDEDCYSNSPPIEYLTECGNGVTTCETKITAHWLSSGSQEYIFQRDCAEDEPNDQPCTEQNFGLEWRKMCTDYCSDDGCNSDQKVENHLSISDSSGSPIDLSCYSCTDEDENICSTEFNVSIRKCPIFANAACFSANTTSTISGTTTQFTFKGCSSFGAAIAEEDIVAGYCREEDYGTVGSSKYCRVLCNGQICNTESVTDNGVKTTVSSFILSVLSIFSIHFIHFSN